MTEAFLSAAATGMERLKWLVLRAFHTLPGDSAARGMSDADYVWCGLQMLLDQRVRQGADGGEAGDNPAFDPRRFQALRGGEA